MKTFRIATKSESTNQPVEIVAEQVTFSAAWVSFWNFDPKRLVMALPAERVLFVREAFSEEEEKDSFPAYPVPMPWQKQAHEGMYRVSDTGPWRCTLCSWMGPSSFSRDEAVKLYREAHGA